jgi:hypothetical protein
MTLTVFRINTYAKLQVGSQAQGVLKSSILPVVGTSNFENSTLGYPTVTLRLCVFLFFA